MLPERRLLFKIDGFILSYCCLMVTTFSINYNKVTNPSIIVLYQLPRSSQRRKRLCIWHERRFKYARNRLQCIVTYNHPMRTERSCVDQKINTFFTCGYIVGMIPSEYGVLTDRRNLWTTSNPDNLALQVFPPRLWFPLMQIIWGVLTFGYVNVTNSFDVETIVTSAVKARSTIFNRYTIPHCSGILVAERIDVGTAVLAGISRVFNFRGYTLCPRGVS